MLSTSHKIRIARCLSAIVLSVRSLFGLPVEVVTARRGLTWSLNLKEGIDLAIYVLGGFELRTLRRYAQLIKEGDVVLDIGANVGAHTLPLAQLVGTTGKVFSFEPTAYAFAKQQTNIALNPSLAPIICAHQIMLTATDAAPLTETVYSSWPLEAADDLHSEHHGRLMSTNGAVTGTLASFVRNEGVERIDFIKLDVDGNENDVLFGGMIVLETFRPIVMMELAPYVYINHPDKFDSVLNLFWSLGYEIADVRNYTKLPHDPDRVRARIPDGGCINVLATP